MLWQKTDDNNVNDKSKSLDGKNVMSTMVLTMAQKTPGRVSDIVQSIWVESRTKQQESQMTPQSPTRSERNCDVLSTGGRVAEPYVHSQSET